MAQRGAPFNVPRDDSDDELEFEFMQNTTRVLQEILMQPAQHGGSRPGRSKNVDRQREIGHERIFRDYFCPESPIYGDVLFRRRFRMRRSLFTRIMNKVTEHDNYFRQKQDAAGRFGLSPIQKCTAAMRMLAYGIAADATDEYCRLGESTAMESLKRFCTAIRSIYKEHYLRQPSREDFETQLQINEQRGWPGLFGSLDCMHYTWKNCPVAWQGQFNNKDGDSSIVLEAVSDQSLYFWHAHFGIPGSNNDITVLDRSPLIDNFLRQDTENMTFQVNGTEYPRYYLLTDGIYPGYSIFVQTIHEPQSEMFSYFAQQQEAVRKDVERAFGVLQARFAIVANPCRMWNALQVKDICMACVLLHNLIVEDEKDLSLEPLFDAIPPPAVRRGLTFDQLRQGMLEIEDEAAHYSLRNDLIEHLWARRGTLGVE